MSLDEAISAIEAAKTMDELRSCLHRIVQNFGFSGFTFIDAGRPELDVPYYTGTHPPAWERTYLQNDFVHFDPALARVRRTNTPFHWGDLKLPEKIGRKRPPALKMMDAAKEHGFKEGFVVPFHYRDRLGGIHSSSTVFFWEDEPHWFQKLFAHHRHELHLIMIYWVQRAMDLVNRDVRNAPALLQPSDGSALVQLTPVKRRSWPGPPAARRSRIRRRSWGFRRKPSKASSSRRCASSMHRTRPTAWPRASRSA